ncbi:MAG: sulfopyruvate decarboxylase subunit beta [Promethearchaeota archaeon]
MKRFDAIKKIVESLNNELIVCNLGAPCRELFSISDRLSNFYMLGSMGLASSIALGVALTQPNKIVWCIDGDGSILMNLGSLSTIANNQPNNLTLIIIDNSTYGSTGNQRTYTSGKTNLKIIAEGAGFKSITIIKKEGDIVHTLKNLGFGCHFVLIKTQPGNALVDNVPLLPKDIKARFMRLLTRKD